MAGSATGRCKNNADIHAKDKFGETPLHGASSNGHLDVVKFLVDMKVDINATTFFGETPLTVAKLKGRTNVAEYLQSMGGVSRGQLFMRWVQTALRRPFR